MSNIIKSTSLQEINDFLEISEDYISKLKLNNNKDRYYYSLVSKSGLEYNFYMSLNTFKYIIDCKNDGISEKLKVEFESIIDFGNIDEEESGIPIKGTSIEILLPNELSLSERNEKMSREFKDRLKNYSPDPFKNLNSENNFKWGGLEGEEAELGFWNTD